MKTSALLFFLLPALPVAAAPLTLSQTIDTVLAQHPSLDSARAAIDSAQGRTRQSNADRLPQVSLSGSYDYSAPRAYVDFDLPSGPTRLYQSVNDNYDVAVHVSQLISDFGRTESTLALARSGVITQKDAVEQVRHQLGYQAIQSFYAVLLLRQSVSVAEDEVRSLEESLRITDQKFTGGKATRYEVLTTKVRIATAQNRRTDTLAQLQKQEAILRQLLGYDATASLDLAGDFAVPASTPDAPSTIAAGLQNRPEMKLALDAEKTAQLKLDVADRTDRPTLSANVEGGVRNGYAPGLFDNTGYVSAGVAVSIPLFTGHRTDGKRAEARADLRGVKARTRELTRSITQEVQGVFADLDASSARLANADTLVAQAQEALELAKNRYANGVITNFELLDAQSSARSAELTRVQARYDCVIARQAIARAAGLAPAAQL